MQAHNENINKGPLSWMARNPVAANILMVVLLVGGFLISTRITKDVFPSFTVGAITISVSYPGATPEEIEKSIVNVIEDSLESVDGIKETAVKISPGTTQLTLTLHDYVDENKVLQDVKAEIDRISTFPKESERPVIALRLRHVEVLNVLLYGNKDYQILRYWADIIKDDLSQSPLIANVEVEGTKEFEIHVEVPQDNLRKYGLKLEDIATVIGDMSIELGGGTLKTRAAIFCSMLMNAVITPLNLRILSCVPMKTAAALCWKISRLFRRGWKMSPAGPSLMGKIRFFGHL